MEHIRQGIETTVWNTGVSKDEVIPTLATRHKAAFGPLYDRGDV
jgi:hypothetical protein